MSGKFRAKATNFLRANHLNATTVHSYPSKALKRIFSSSNVAESRPLILVHGCFTLFGRANNATNWHLYSHCLNISNRWQKTIEMKTSRWFCDSAVVKVQRKRKSPSSWTGEEVRKVGSWRCKRCTDRPTNRARVVCSRLVASPLRPLLLLIARALQTHLIFVIFTRILRLRNFTPKSA